MMRRAPEPEGVSPAVVVRGETSMRFRQAMLADRAQDALAWRELPLGERVRRARELPRGLVNAAVTGDLRVLDRLLMMDAPDAAVARRLDVIEAKLLGRRAA